MRSSSITLGSVNFRNSRIQGWRMARWTGDDHVSEVLKGSDAWRERCVLQDSSLFSDENLWTAVNIAELKKRIVDNPIEGTDKDFYEKLELQLQGASNEVIHLAAEVSWFYLLFPHKRTFGPEKKSEQIKRVWSWSGGPASSNNFLEDDALSGVGHPGTAYLTRRFDEFKYFLEVMEDWKNLPHEERDRLLNEDKPWEFVKWLDQKPGSDKRPMRNAILYFLFPDDIERNLSNEHRRQIVKALYDKIPEDLRPAKSSPTLFECDRAISGLRAVFENELGSTQIDFYHPPIYGQWWIGLRDKSKTLIAGEIKDVLGKYGLELRQCGSKKKTLADCYDVNSGTGFWAKPSEATNKPLRWLIHLELDDDQVIARVPDEAGSQRIAFANTAQGTSGAISIRVIPAIKVDDGKFVFYETWEWMLLFCFYPALKVGSSGQLLDDFDPSSGRLSYMNEEQDYIASALITLNEGDDVFMSPDLSRPVQYGEATDAIQNLIQVNPSFMTGTIDGAKDD